MDRGPVASQVQSIERGKGFVGDMLRIGAAGETWVIDTIRVWAVPNTSPGCPKNPADRIERITLLGALDNPPVPGQPECACHAVIPIVTASLTKGDVSLTPVTGLWQIDFKNVRWSVPGGTDILISVRPTARKIAACPVARTWTLAAAPAEEGHRLRTFDKDSVPDGYLPSANGVALQVRAHRAEK
jgi:hypothetical protein